MCECDLELEQSWLTVKLILHPLPLVFVLDSVLFTVYVLYYMLYCISAA